MSRHKLLFAVALFCGGAAFAQMPQNYDRGFAPDKVYQYGELDHVNHFNGNLVLTVPLGPSFPLKSTSYQLTLVYNSSIWDSMQVYPIEPTNPCYINTGNCLQLWSFPGRRFNAGIGWTLSLGRQFEQYDVEGGSSGPIYQSPDGGDHPIPLTTGNPPVGARAFDGSYLRKTSTGIDTPDGAKREFFDDASLKPANGYGWLRKMRDANGNGVDVEQFYVNGFLSEWRITDTEGRVHHVYFSDLGSGGFAADPPGTPLPEQRVAATSVVLQGPAGNMIYTLEYGAYAGSTPTTLIGNSCAGADNTGYGDFFRVPLLRKITLPDSTYYEASYTGNSACDPGQLETFQLAAVKGQLQWTYGSYLYPDGSCSTNPYHGTYGVRERRLVDVNGTLIGKWTYTPALVQSSGVSMLCEHGGDSGQSITKNVKQEMTTTVEDPFGLRMVYHFSVLPELAASVNGTVVQKEEYGFPMSRLRPNAITPRRYLSTEKQTCSACDENGANCGGGPYCTTVEEKYIRYVADDTVVNSSGEVVSLGPTGDNPRVESEQTTAYSGTSSESSWLDRSDFDGFGHYRKTSASGSFLGSPVHETYTDFNPGSDAAGTVASPGGGRVPAFSSTDAWVLNTYDFTSESENGQYSKTEACFDKTHAFLSASRTLKNAGTSAATVPRSASDLMAWFTNGGGVVSKEEYFGGDLQANLADTALCDLAKPASAEYAIGHTYSHGALATSSYYDGTTELLPKIVDRTLALSGVPLSERDSAGLETTYTYDSSGRVQQVQPPGSAAVTYTYGFAQLGVGPIGYVPAAVTVERGDTKAIYQFDSFGHVWRELHRMPADMNGGTFWSVHQTDRDAAGRTEWDSTPERIADPTNDLAYVPPKKVHFVYVQEGYLAAVVQPDGTSVSSTPSLLSQAVRRAPFTRADGSSQMAVTTERRDPLGRLRSVSEITLGDPSTLHTTDYTYELSGHLSAVTMTRNNVTQNRWFQYDQRGFLTSETHPEKGVDGNGTVSYVLDSRGHVRQKLEGITDGPFDLKFDYDKRERLTAITEADPASNLTPKARRDLKAFTFGSTNVAVTGGTDYRRGKLFTATRHNRDAALGDVTVTEAYHYVDGSGRMSSRDTDVATTAAFDGATFSTGQQWSSLDQVTSVSYPQTPTSAVAANRTVGNTYANGFLTSVGTYASEIKYHPNGSPDEVLHGLSPNATVQKWTRDPDHMARPCSILAAPPGTTIAASAGAPCGYTITGNIGNWNTGRYLYDASGNITQIGTRSYAYDWLNRLALEREGGFSTAYQYDGFGNMTMQTTTNTAAAAPSTGGSYGGTVLRSFNAIAVNAATNRLTGRTFDAAGNVTVWSSDTSYAWDNAGSMHALHAPGRDVVYLYTADDERVASVARIADVNLVTRNRTTWTLRGPSNQLLRTWVDDSTSGTRTWSWSEDEIWRGSTLLATETLTGTRHIFTDHLGSPRFLTDSAGQPLGTIAFAPFGQGGATGVGALQFTGHERDLGLGTADALDYMHARYYSAAVGRFLSVDPALDSDNLLVPQSWNRYSYVRNNPIGRTDPTGRVDLTSVPDYVFGVISAFGTDLVAGYGRPKPTSDAMAVGQVAGDLLAIGAGSHETTTGVGTALVGAGVTAGTAGLSGAISLPAVALGTVVAVHGVSVSGTAAAHLVQAGVQMSSVNQMNKEVKRGQAPAEVKRVDSGKVPNEQDHVHFNDKNKSALNQDGTWKHGFAQLKKATLDWLEHHGWTLP
jgi:RHS repeat-associated protein